MAMTAKELAKLLGVSPTTVSMALNKKGQLSKRTRELVLQAAAEHGLIRHLGASAPPDRSLLLVVYQNANSYFPDELLTELTIQGIAKTVQTLKYRMLVAYCSSDQSEEERLCLIQEHNASGIIFLAAEPEEADLKIFQRLKVPVVLLGSCRSGNGYDSVSVDNAQGMRIAIQYMLQWGHTKIGYLNGSYGSHSFADRRACYCQALEALLPAGTADPFILPIRPTLEDAYQDMLEYLSTQPTLPTAFLADSGLIAAGCLLALHRTGHQVPEEVSILGFGDLPLCQVTTPPLTTIAVSGLRMGSLAVQLLDQRLQGLASPERVRTLVLPELRERDSVSRIR